MRTLRDAYGLTLVELAARIAAQGVSVTPAALTNVEAGRRHASVKLAAAWAKALGVHPLDLRQEEDLRALICDGRHQ